MSAPAGKARRGMTLIEVSALLIPIALLMSLSANLLYRAGEVHRKSVEQLHELELLRIWSDRMRQDALAASDAIVADRLRLDQAGGVNIVYLLEQNHLRRQFWVEAELLLDEPWGDLRFTSAEWRVDRSGQLPLLTARLQFGDESDDQREYVWHVRVGAHAGPEVEEEAQ